MHHQHAQHPSMRNWSIVSEASSPFRGKGGGTKQPAIDGRDGGRDSTRDVWLYKSCNMLHSSLSAFAAGVAGQRTCIIQRLSKSVFSVTRSEENGEISCHQLISNPAKLHKPIQVVIIVVRRSLKLVVVHEILDRFSFF